MSFGISDRLAILLAGMVIAGLAGAWAAGAAQDKHEVTRMTEKMQTACVGRFLVDMPEEARIELTRARVDGFNLSTFNESDEEFSLRLAQRETDLRAVPDRLGGDNNLESVKEVKTRHGLSGRIYVHGRSVQEGTRAKGLELEHYRHEGVEIEALLHGAGISIDITATNYDAEFINELPRLVEKVVPNPDNRIPTEPGFCIERAYILDPLPAEQGETVMMFAFLPSRPDIEFKMISAAGITPPSEGLLARGAVSDARLPPGDRERVLRLRAEARTINGLDGEELIERYTEENDAIVYSFWWELGGTDDNVLAPYITFKMDTGMSRNGPIPTSLSEGAAIQLWEMISSSFRIRPIAQRPTADSKAVPVALGVYAYAGQACPQSGWWESSDGGNGIAVLGGQRQYIKQGDQMPQALLLPPPTLWERLRGLQPSFESTNRTSWKLVDKRSQERVSPVVPLAKATVPATGAAVAMNKSTKTGGQHVSLGSYAATGSPCPASGWWRCEDSHALDGTRWFAEGSLLPPATFAVPASVFGRSTTAPKVIQRRGAWRLVRHSAMPEFTGREQSSTEGVGSSAHPSHDA